VHPVRRRDVRDGHGRVDGAVPALGGHARQAVRAAALPDPHAPAVGGRRRHRVRHLHPGGAVQAPQPRDGRAHRRAHRADGRADHRRLRPRPVVHGAGGARVRLRRPRHHPSQPDPRLEPERERSMSNMWTPGGRAPEPAQSRYVLPSFVERTSYGVKESNPYNKLFEERIIFLGVQIDDASANDVMAQLLCLESADPDREISMYINSPGGSFTSLMAIYDTMQFIRPDIQTVCLGQAASAAAVLLAAGTPGRRLAVQNARVLIHQPATEGFYGQVSDLEIQAAEISRMRRLLEHTLAKRTNRSPE